MYIHTASSGAPRPRPRRELDGVIPMPSMTWTVAEGLHLPWTRSGRTDLGPSVGYIVASLALFFACPGQRGASGWSSVRAFDASGARRIRAPPLVKPDVSPMAICGRSRRWSLGLPAPAPLPDAGSTAERGVGGRSAPSAVAAMAMCGW